LLTAAKVAKGESRALAPHEVGMATGKPVTLILTPGQQHEATVFAPLMEQGAVKQGGTARTGRCFARRSA